MRIAIACATLGMVERGGEIQLCELARRMARRGHEVSIYSGAPLAIVGVAVLPQPTSPSWPMARDRLDRWWFALHAYRRMWEDPPDVVVPITPPVHEHLARAMRRMHGTRMVSLGLGGPDHDRMRLEQGPDLFLAPSPRAVREAKALAPRTRVQIMPPGVDLDWFTPRGDAAAIGELPRPIIGIVGALIPCKRVELAIDAVRLMSRGSLLVIGKGPLRARLEARARKSANPIRFLDGVPAREMPRYYRAMDVLCFPADPGETFGMVIVEALACGTAVVATDDEVRRWILGSTLGSSGFVCDVTQARPLAEALDRAGRGGERNVAARAAAERFSWEHASDILDAELSRLARPDLRS